MTSCTLILASGAGSRTGLDMPKQFFKIKNKTILEYAVETFERHTDILSIVIVSNPEYFTETKNIVSKYKKIIKIVKGGETRQKSSYNGLKSIEKMNFDNVLIHDAARPFADADTITGCIDALKRCQAAAPAVDCSDTILQVNKDGVIDKIPDRQLLRRCQTPQAFNYNLILKAHELAAAEKYFSASDDCSLILRYNLAPVHTVQGNPNNIKITYMNDIYQAEKIAQQYNYFI